jgi:hypothetical protein
MITAVAAQAHATIRSVPVQAIRDLASTTAYPIRWSTFSTDTDAVSVTTEPGTSLSTAGRTKGDQQMHPDPDKDLPDGPLILLGMAPAISLHKTAWIEAGRGLELQRGHRQCTQVTASPTLGVDLTASTTTRPEVALWRQSVTAASVSPRSTRQRFPPPLAISLRAAPGAPALSTPDRRTAMSRRLEVEGRLKSPPMSLPAVSPTRSPTTTRAGRTLGTRRHAIRPTRLATALVALMNHPQSLEPPMARQELVHIALWPAAAIASRHAQSTGIRRRLPPCCVAALQVNSLLSPQSWRMLRTTQTWNIRSAKCLQGIHAFLRILSTWLFFANDWYGVKGDMCSSRQLIMFGCYVQ